MDSLGPYQNGFIRTLSKSEMPTALVEIWIIIMTLMSLVCIYSNLLPAISAGAVEYTNCVSAEG